MLTLFSRAGGRGEGREGREGREGKEGREGGRGRGEGRGREGRGARKGGGEREGLRIARCCVPMRAACTLYLNTFLHSADLWLSCNNIRDLLWFVSYIA